MSRVYESSVYVQTTPRLSVVKHALMRSVGSTQNKIASLGVRASSGDLSMKLIRTTKCVAQNERWGSYAVCVDAEYESIC